MLVFVSDLVVFFRRPRCWCCLSSLSSLPLLSWCFDLPFSFGAGGAGTTFSGDTAVKASAAAGVSGVGIDPASLAEQRIIQ